MNFLQSTSSLRRLCDYYVSPAPCKPLSGGASPLDGSSGTGPLMNQSQPKHLLELTRESLKLLPFSVPLI